MAAAAPSSSPPPPRRIVICGGGVIGVCTAYFLASKSPSPLSLTIVERSSIACAASGKSGGFLALDWCDNSPPLSALARASFSLHRSLSLLLRGPQSYAYRPLTALSLPLSPPSPPPRSPPALPPWIDAPAAGLPRTIGTLETTAQLHPGMFTRAVMAAAAEEYGVEVVVGEVRSVGAGGSGVGLRDGRVLAADAVVVAMGPWSGRLRMVADLFNVSGMKAHSVVLRPPEPEVITPHALFLSYQDGPGGKILDPEVYPRPDNPEDVFGEPESIVMLHQIAGTLSSHLKAGVAEVCFLPRINDTLPVIGENLGPRTAMSTPATSAQVFSMLQPLKWRPLQNLF